jgi:hypothetical protein
MVPKVNIVFGKGPKLKQGPKPKQGSQLKKQHRERLDKEKLAHDVGESNSKNPKKVKMVKKAKPVKKLEEEISIVGVRVLERY